MPLSPAFLYLSLTAFFHIQFLLISLLWIAMPMLSWMLGWGMWCLERKSENQSREVGDSLLSTAPLSCCSSDSFSGYYCTHQPLLLSPHWRASWGCHAFLLWLLIDFLLHPSPWSSVNNLFLYILYTGTIRILVEFPLRSKYHWEVSTMYLAGQLTHSRWS